MRDVVGFGAMLFDGRGCTIPGAALIRARDQAVEQWVVVPPTAQDEPALHPAAKFR